MEPGKSLGFFLTKFLALRAKELCPDSLYLHRPPPMWGQ